MEPSKMWHFSDLGDGVKSQVAALCHIEVGEIEDVYPCTPVQVALMAQPNKQAHSKVAVFSLAPSTDKDKLCASVSQVVAATPILRTRLVDCELGLVQVVFLPREKATPMPPGANLTRAAMVESKLVLTVHHALTDHPTLEAFLGDVACAYRGTQPKQRGCYKPFVEHCLSIDDTDARSFWASRFSGQPVAFPPTKPGYCADATVKIKPLSVTPSASGVATADIPSYIEVALALTLASYTKADSVAFGYVMSGRHCTHGVLQSTMGPTSAPFPVQVNLKPMSTLRDLLKERTRERHEVTKSPSLQYGLQRIRAVSEASRAASEFNTILDVRPLVEDPSYTEVLRPDSEYKPHGTYCLALACLFEKDSVSVEALFDRAITCDEQINRILQQFEHVLHTIMQLSLDTEMDQIKMVSDHDREAMVEWNKSMPEPLDTCLHDQIDEIARQQPAAIAVDGPDGTLTYEQLRSHSSALARELQSRGVEAETAVALVLEKSIWVTVAQLAVLKAGGTCVPIDPGYPLPQKQAIVARCRTQLLLTSPALEEALSGVPTDVLAVDGGFLASLGPAEGAAYILFTSGSTGAPKGVILEHHSLVTSLMAVGRRLDWTRGLRVGASIVESLGTLLFGGTVCVPSEEERRSGLVDVIRAKDVQCTILTPTVIRLILRILLSGGESVDPEAVRLWSNKVRFFNAWGQSETAVVSTMAELTPTSPWLEAIGTPIGCALWVVDERDANKLVPIGTVGEILVEGTTVARCYLDDKEKTASAFIAPPPWAPTQSMGRRMFRTGAMGRFCPDGSILYVGRSDSQVKISGQRFELEEVEKALCSHPLSRPPLRRYGWIAATKND
ncbi:Nonribosomal peptide synthase atnA [Apiospora kogelbergensis]|uniref:Nonribosomal peptide synthase atnA n=1 Tax=Apiospora kogelbergensis TaxID=1337665 RepID=UPI00312ED4B5